MLDKMVAPFFLCFGMVYVPVIAGLNWDRKWKFIVCWAIWLVFSRSVRLAYYLIKKPWNIVFIPFFIVFQYVQGIIRIIALFTIYERGWRTRNIKFNGNEIARDGNEAKVADDMQNTETVAGTSVA